jgi:hypothetical protein
MSMWIQKNSSLHYHQLDYARQRWYLLQRRQIICHCVWINSSKEEYLFRQETRWNQAYVSLPCRLCKGLHYGIFWYSDYEGETDVSLNCGRFYGPVVRPRMRMNEWMGEWMSERTVFLFLEMRSPRWNDIDSEKNLSQCQWVRTQAAAVRGR